MGLSYFVVLDQADAPSLVVIDGHVMLVSNNDLRLRVPQQKFGIFQLEETFPS